MLWVWVFFFPFLISLLSFFGGVFFLNSSYLLMWDISFFRESNFEMILLFDLFSMMFLFTVGLVSGFVLLYSNYYMKESLFKKKFIVVMMVFIFSMFLLSMSGDLVWLMVGWDGLGFSSMCLIFFFQNWKSFNSAMVTFISNRIGDFFIISFFCFNLMLSGSLFYKGEGWGILGLFLCFGAFSKSAQVPFSAWLPLPMAAPTPVSSLVHSSTLVTAGVFLLIRFKSFLSKMGMSGIFFGSFLTFVLAGMSSLSEYDLKKIIALSTLSHMGLMMSFVGMESFVSAKIHLINHAFFKSLLIMTSGFMIHDNNNFQDIRLISVSSSNFFFSLSFILSLKSMGGAPFFSGFFSKEIFLGKVFLSILSMEMGLLFFFSVSFNCSYSIPALYYFFSPFFSLFSLSSKSGYPEKAFFFMSIVSSFFKGLILLKMVEKEKMISFSFFSLFQKMSMKVGNIFCLIIWKVFSFFFSYMSFWMMKICQMMWMIGSSNNIFQKFVYSSSFFMMMKSDVKSMLDYYVFFFFDLFKYLSGALMKILFTNPFVFVKMCCWNGNSLFFFHI
uniref:NADH:ubiquinone reductase (H(+)-translocating) n=1 Tax=Coloceras sp. SLC-2011 TaxID=1075158 RepID=G1EN63_9NEOP|nr:NADH dehydrogenase subunit 5 [Coloceras sp. SLC-2011]